MSSSDGSYIQSVCCRVSRAMESQIVRMTGVEVLDVVDAEMDAHHRSLSFSTLLLPWTTFSLFRVAIVLRPRSS